MPVIDPLLSLAFAMDANRGAHAILLGSGVSRAAGIPTGWQVVLDLINRLAAAMGEDAGADPAAWYSAKFGKEPDYSELLDSLAKTPEERRGILHSYFEANEEEREQGLKQPTAAHRSVARLAAKGYVRVILTPNFDRLTETALRDEGVEPVIISSADGIAGAPPMAHWRCVVIKINGDYLDPRIRNTVQELAGYDPETEKLLDRLFDEFGLIISGWSGIWDEGLRAAMLRCPTRRYSSLWGEPGKLADRARQLATLRAIEVVEGTDADTLFRRLEETLTSLDEIKERKHPLTPTIAVTTAKRLLAEPDKNRIRLHDLVMDEVGRVCEACTLEHFPVQGVSPTSEELTRRLERYEAATATLCALAATFAKWGNDSHRSLWTRALELLDQQTVTRGGLALWNELQRYPTLLVMYAGGIGAVDAGRFDWMRAFIADPIRRDNGKSHPMGMRLDAAHHLGKWRAHLPGMDRYRTPGSDHLYDKLRSCLNETVPAESAYMRAFDQFEFLFALWRAAKDTYGFFGCFAWREEYDLCEEMIVEAQKHGAEWGPIQSGLLAGDVFLPLAKVKTAVEKLGWRW